MLWNNSERIDSMEHYRDYWDNFAGFPYLYYCRRCIRNFNTKVRVRVCNKCLKEDIVELPAYVSNVPTSRLRFGKRKFSLDFLNKKILATEKGAESSEKEEKPTDSNFKQYLGDISKKWKAAIKKLKKEAKEDAQKDEGRKKDAKKFSFSLFKKPEEEYSSNYADRFKDKAKKD